MVKKYIILVFLLTLCSCVLTAPSYKRSYKDVLRVFDIDASTHGIPKLVWLDEKTYWQMQKLRAWLPPDSMGWYAKILRNGKIVKVIYIREKYRNSIQLQEIFDHELGHFAFDCLSRKEQSEYFTRMYVERWGKWN